MPHRKPHVVDATHHARFGISHVKGKDYAYPRYQFSNRSDDIRKLFTDTCDRLGVQWRQWTRYHVSVAQRESVAFLDSFIGPKY